MVQGCELNCLSSFELTYVYFIELMLIHSFKKSTFSVSSSGTAFWGFIPSYLFTWAKDSRDLKKETNKKKPKKTQTLKSGHKFSIGGSGDGDIIPSFSLSEFLCEGGG